VNEWIFDEILHRGRDWLKDLDFGGNPIQNLNLWFLSPDLYHLYISIIAVLSLLCLPSDSSILSGGLCCPSTDFWLTAAISNPYCHTACFCLTWHATAVVSSRYEPHCLPACLVVTVPVLAVETFWC